MVLHKLKKRKFAKVISYMLLVSLLITSVPLGEGIQAAEKQRIVVEKQRVIEEIVEKDLPDESDVIEVTDLGAFTEAVQEITSEDDLTPAYEFQVDSTTAVVDGEEQQISVPVQESGESYVVPEDVFAEDDAVNQEAITDGDGVVSLDAVAEISNYEIVEQEDTVELINPFQSKRLIVKSPEGFDPYGAVSIIQGYEQLFILTYETEEDTKAAYEYLQTIPYLTVEPDAVIASATVVEEVSVVDEEKTEETSMDNATDTENHAVTVAVLDTGYDYAGNDTARIKDGIDVSGTGNVQDNDGHGTQMANIIKENTSEEVSVLPIRVTDENGRSSSLKVYLGILTAIEQNADIMNISMTSYKSASAFLVTDAVEQAYEKGIFVVTSAGNYRSDVVNFVPANIENAIVVSAVNKDKVFEEYSNYGETVDYSSYGTIETTGLNAQRVTATGTSAAAAVVTACIGQMKSKLYDTDLEEMIARINEQAEDAGETGWDAQYGNGILDIDTLTILEENEDESEEAEEGLCGLLTCDWKNISDEELDTYIGYATNIQRRIFIDSLSDAELQELLARDTMFSRKIVYIESDISEDGEDMSESFRMNDTLYNILMSKEVSDEYELQRDYEEFTSDFNSSKHNYNTDSSYGNTLHVYQWGAENVSCVKVDTTANESDATIYCYLQVTDEERFAGKIKYSIDEGKSAFHFSDATPTTNAVIDESDHGNKNVIRIRFEDVKVDKPQGYVINFSNSDSDWKKTGTLDGVSFGAPYYSVYNHQVQPSNDATHKAYYYYQGANGRYFGGFWQLGGASGDNCKSKTITTSFDIGAADTSAERPGLTYRLPLKKHTLNASEKNVTDEKATCSEKGSYHVETTYTCNTCDKTWTEDGKSKDIAQKAHSYGTDWITATNNNIEDGVRYHQCTRSKANCGRGKDKNGEAWQKDFQYLQRIGYRLMDVDGNYPSSYTYAVNGYYASGSSIGQYGTAAWVASECGSEFMAASNAVAAYKVGTTAKVVTMNIARKRYNVVFDGNGANSGSTAAHTNVCVGKTFNLNKNGFVRTGYNFLGWSKNKDGSGTIIKDGKAAYNLSTTNGDTVKLYAVWEPSVFKITLDNQGADEGKDGEDKIYEKYSIGYYTDQNATQHFVDDKIEIPEKNVPAEELIGGERQQLFLGYYTKKNGEGYAMIKRDGSLIANIAGAGNYKYFTANTTVYAAWEDMLAIQFDVNLTEQDMEILSHDENGNEIKDAVNGPDTQWKEYGKDITINYETVEINNDTFKSIYRLKGWSLTPEISSDEEIILSDEITSYTFAADEDVTLYAQWDTSFMVTYMGNQQTEGNDYLDKVEDVTDTYTFNPNDEEQVAVLQNDDADYFVKTVEKPTMDIESGKMEDENGTPYTETVQYSFLGWSMYDDQENQLKRTRYAMEKGEEHSAAIVKAAAEVGETEPGKGLTFSNPSADYGTFNAAHMSTRDLIVGSKGSQPNEVTLADAVKGYLTQITGMPYVNMYAIWDEYPQIAVSDLYFPLSYAQEGRITEEYLLNYAVATDAELQSDTNPEGKMKNGEDTVNKTKFTVLDYQISEFVGAESDMAMSITYRAEDSVGNVTEKMVMVHLVDTEATEYDPGYVRFISAEYADTLSENSIWRTGDYATTLSEVLGNSKTGEEYTTVSSLQQALGVKSVKKPGSGTWNQVEQVWEFTHEEVLAVHEYVESNGLFGSQDGFLSTFSHCRVQ